MKKIILWGVFLFSLTFLVGCEDDNDPFVGSDNFITSFKLKQGENSYEALLRGDTIILATPDGVVLSEVTPDIVCSENSSIKPDPSTIIQTGRANLFRGNFSQWCGKKIPICSREEGVNF